MTKLTIPPDLTYSVQDGVEVISVQLDGGAPRMRRDILGATSTVDVEWRVGRDEFLYLRAFYRSVTVSGSEPFTIDLVLDSPSTTEHTARFKPGSMRLTGQEGYLHVVSAQLDVTPILPDTEYDIGMVAVWNEYGSAYGTVFAALSKLVNEDLLT